VTPAASLLTGAARQRYAADATNAASEAYAPAPRTEVALDERDRDDALACRRATILAATDMMIV